jgi:hypothetical protein
LPGKEVIWEMNLGKLIADGADVRGHAEEILKTIVALEVAAQQLYANVEWPKIREEIEGLLDGLRALAKDVV